MNTAILLDGMNASTASWVDNFAGKWKDNRSTSQIIKDIHAARTSNSEIIANTPSSLLPTFHDHPKLTITQKQPLKL